jgi:hypothetical protein
MPRRTADERAEIRRLLLDTVIAGTHPTAVVRQVAQRFEIGERSVWRQYKSVREELQQAGQVHKDPEITAEHFALAVMQRNYLYRKALLAGELMAALRAIDDRDHLLGLFPDQRGGVKHSGKDSIGSVQPIRFIDRYEDEKEAEAQLTAQPNGDPVAEAS